MADGSGRTWWLGVGETGLPLFIQASPGDDVKLEQRLLGGHDWSQVTPLAFYRALVAHLQGSPSREEAYLEAMEETLEQWERASAD
jgi:hypothetical protein